MQWFRVLLSRQTMVRQTHNSSIPPGNSTTSSKSKTKPAHAHWNSANRLRPPNCHRTGPVSPGWFPACNACRTLALRARLTDRLQCLHRLQTARMPAGSGHRFRLRGVASGDRSHESLDRVPADSSQFLRAFCATHYRARGSARNRIHITHDLCC